LTDPAAHARGSDLRRDAHGRRAGSAPAGSRHGGSQHRLRGEAAVTASAGEDDEHLEAEAFARSVAQRLTEHLQAKRFDELRIAAAPRFLGLLRQALSPQVAQCVGTTLSKDLIHLSNRELTERLFEDKAPARAR
jgi:protein required for attachment to host cells